MGGVRCELRERAHPLHAPSSLLPINYTSFDTRAVAQATNDTLTTTFMRLTISSIPSGSPLLWSATPRRRRCLPVPAAVSPRDTLHPP